VLSLCSPPSPRTPCCAFSSSACGETARSCIPLSNAYNIIEIVVETYFETRQIKKGRFP
jgi:hypothetical protein